MQPEETYGPPQCHLPWEADRPETGGGWVGLACQSPDRRAKRRAAAWEGTGQSGPAPCWSGQFEVTTASADTPCGLFLPPARLSVIQRHCISLSGDILILLANEFADSTARQQPNCDNYGDSATLGEGDFRCGRPRRHAHKGYRRESLGSDGLTRPKASRAGRDAGAEGDSEGDGRYSTSSTRRAANAGIALHSAA